MDGISLSGLELTLQHGSAEKAMTTTKVAFSQYRPSTHGTRSLDEAISEVQREMDVRRRLFDRWVQDGKMSWVDANDRLCRLMSALTFLLAHLKLHKQAEADDMPEASTPSSFTQPISLDEHVAAEAA